jgi:hypothetical protein
MHSIDSAIDNFFLFSKLKWTIRIIKNDFYMKI